MAQQIVLITGASSGIGLVTAKLAAARGASVFLVARNAEALRDAVESIAASGGTADYAVADVAELGEVRAAATKAILRFGRIDCWVNNAGVAIYGALVDTPEDEHQRLFQTNYFGVVHGALTAIEHLRNTGGALITVASIAADIPSPVMGAYAASKHAVKGYIESLRIEIDAAALPISVSLIKPSGISTPIAEHAANHVDGEALIPPPVYDPLLVAEAILEAAEHPRRDITVGGMGRLQVLAGTHFPGILARFGGLLGPLLSDPDRPKTLSDNLASPAHDGEQRSPVQAGRRKSLYRLARTNHVAMAATALGMISLAAMLFNQRGRSSKI